MDTKPGTDPIYFRSGQHPGRAVNRVRPRFAGFTLVEILVVLLIFGVLLSMAAIVTRAVTATQKRSVTMTRLATVEAAIVQFVQQQKRLPCPGDGTLVSTHANAGTEGARTAAGCTGNQQNGVVPWRALGLTELEATDGWDRRLTLRIDSALAADSGMNLSWCDPAGTGGLVGGLCNTNCTNTSLGNCTPPATYLQGKGLRVKNIAGTILMEPAPAGNSPHTGAAFVLISHGDTAGGGYTSAGVLAPSVTTDGTEEMKNYASVAYVSLAATYYVSDTINDAAGNSHFDDLLLHPAVMTVVSKAGLGPRSH